jgi:hypothetical protein
MSVVTSSPSSSLGIEKDSSNCRWASINLIADCRALVNSCFSSAWMLRLHSWTTDIYKTKNIYQWRFTPHYTTLYYITPHHITACTACHMPPHTHTPPTHHTCHHTCTTYTPRTCTTHPPHMHPAHAPHIHYTYTTRAQWTQPRYLILLHVVVIQRPIQQCLATLSRPNGHTRVNLLQQHVVRPHAQHALVAELCKVVSVVWGVTEWVSEWACGHLLDMVDSCSYCTRSRSVWPTGSGSGSGSEGGRLV